MSRLRERTGHGYLGCCETCDDKDPHWEIVRIGDVVVTWACDDHLATQNDRHDGHQRLLAYRQGPYVQSDQVFKRRIIYDRPAQAGISLL